MKLSDILVTAFEGGSNYWINSVRPISGETGRPWYDTDDKHIMFQLEDDEGDKHTLVGIDILNAAERRNVVDLDADDADFILQMAVYGEIVYG